MEVLATSIPRYCSTDRGNWERPSKNLTSRKQRDGESLEEFLHALQRLSKNCEFKNVTAQLYREEMIRDAFINNMSSNEIRTRLLEHSVICLQETVNKAMALNFAKENAKLYTKPDPIIHLVSAADPGIEMTNTSAVIKQEYYFCGKRRHPRANCPARNTTDITVAYVTTTTKLHLRITFTFCRATGGKGGKSVCGERSSAVCIGVDIRRAPPGLLNVCNITILYYLLYPVVYNKLST
ncbi:hypothetical protein T08_15509 [Trichinella sp. T8]|nr:hypothetical protein T08_15509 [Trichinella sp. T8]